jgi:hypothetical protein
VELKNASAPRRFPAAAIESSESSDAQYRDVRLQNDTKAVAVVAQMAATRTKPVVEYKGFLH